jgi:glutamate-1-semialdehyde 2,1-aminomutase
MTSFSDRLHSVIPGGAHTYSRGDDQFPSNAPSILERGKGAYVWDPEGNRYLDYGMALRAVTLGYANERITQAAYAEMIKGVNLTRASLTELEAAEMIVELIPGAEMVKFAKNGSNVTTAAVKIARAYTGRRYVCIPRQHPFFSFDDWFIGTTPVKRGIPPDHYSSTLIFDYGDIKSLEKLFDEYTGQIACVMLEPATTLIPCPLVCEKNLTFQEPCSACPSRQEGFLHKVQKLCRRENALFILDEMITGFRWHLNGAQTYFGVEPDLSTFGKAMANGFSAVALTGKREFMEVGATQQEGMERTFLLSTTHGAEMVGLGAFMETVRVYREQDVVKHLWTYGRSLLDGMTVQAAKHGLENYFEMEGSAITMNYVTRDMHGNVSLPLRTLFSQEMVKRGVLMPWIAVSLAHTQHELSQTLEAVDGALKVYKDALYLGVERFLEGPPIRPVFRRVN